MIDNEWLKNVLEQCAARGLRTIPVKDRTPIKKHGNGEDYKDLSSYRNANRVAIKLGDMIALDYDGKKDGVISIEDLEEVLDLDLVGMPKMFQVNDLGNSTHWLFKLPEGFTANLKASAIDAWPKVDVLTGSYLLHLSPEKIIDWSAMDDLEDCPSIILERLDTGYSKAVAVAVVGDEDDMGLMEAVEAANRAKLSDDEVLFYLSKLDQDHLDNRDKWLGVGMALHHQYSDDTEAGWSIFDTWSKGSEDYDEDKNRASWDSFGKRGAINVRTFASVIHSAGGVSAKNDMLFGELVTGIEAAKTTKDIERICVKVADSYLNSMQIDSLASKLVVAYAEVTNTKTTKAAVLKQIKLSRTETRDGDFIDEYVFMSSENKFIHRTTKEQMGREAFNIVHGHLTPNDEDGRPLAPSQYSVGRIETVNKTMYFPKAGDIFTRNGIAYLNEYRPSPLVSVKPVTDLVDRVIAHITHMLPDQYERDLVINYLAHNVQHAGKKIQWSIILQGVQGDGKSFLSEMMQHVLSIDNVRILSPQTLESSSFTGWATGQCMTFIEEMKVGGGARYDVINHMKPYITNDVIEVVRKGKDPLTAVNTTNYMAFTNFKDAMPLDDSDRRYCVLASQWQNKNAIEAFNNANPSYYSDLYEALRAHAGEVKYWLENLVIPDWFYATKRAPDTNAKRMMIQDSMPMGMQLVLDALEDFEEEVMEGDELNASALQRAADENSQIDVKYRDFPRTSALSKFLGNLGWEKSDRRRPKNDPRGNKVTLYRKGG
jgi:hypothetical protein